MLRVGLIGYGYWGPNLARNFHEHPGCKLVRIADKSDERRAVAAARYQDAEVVENGSALTKAGDLDVIVIATPVSFHYDLAVQALENGKHVFVEKPFTSSTEQAKKLTELAAAKKLTLMVDHTFLFTSSVKKMKALVSSGELGELFYYDSVRVNLGLFQHDVNVVWDLAPHDLSILNYLVDKRPLAVSAHGAQHFNTGLEDVAYLTLSYPGNFIAHFHVNWLSPVKIRKTLIGGSKKMVVWDDLDPEDKVKIYDRGVDLASREGVYQALTEYRTGDMLSPNLPAREALRDEIDYFVQCVDKSTQPLNDAQAGTEVVEILEAASKSLMLSGEFVEL